MKNKAIFVMVGAAVLLTAIFIYKDSKSKQQPVADTGSALTMEQMEQQRKKEADAKALKEEADNYVNSIISNSY